MSNVAPTPYPGVPNANIQGPPQYPDDQPNISPPYGGGGPIIIVQEPKQYQQQQQVMGHQRGGGTSHITCCVICFLTGGLSLPCWICSCLADEA